MFDLSTTLEELSANSLNVLLGPSAIMFVHSPVLRQYLYVIAANMSALSVGLGLAWTSPVIAKLLDRNSTVLPRTITDEEATWVASIPQLPCAPLAFVIPVLINCLGRRDSLIASFAPKILSCLLLIFASKVWHVILARLLEGVSFNLACCSVSTYTSEIADKTRRGTLGSFTQIFMSFGVIMMIVGPFLSYTALNVAYGVVSGLCLLPILFLPKSPYFLYSKDKIEESVKLLNMLRRSEEEIREELLMYQDMMKEKQSTLRVALKKTHFLKALGICCAIGIGSQLSGFNFVAQYFQTVMKSTQTVSPEMASAVFGTVQLISCGFPIFTTDKFGRKPVLCFTLLLIGLGMAGMGTFFWLKESGRVFSGTLNYLPLLAMIIVNFGYTSGLGSIIFVIMPELFDGPERGLGVTAGLTCLAVACFILNKSYAVILAGIGAAAVYWMFSAFCVIFCLFIIIVIPETKGKLFRDIQKTLKNKSVKKIIVQ